MTEGIPVQEVRFSVFIAIMGTPGSSFPIPEITDINLRCCSQGGKFSYFHHHVLPIIFAVAFHHTKMMMHVVRK